MNNTKYVFISIISFLVFVLLQINIFNKISIFSVVPNVCIIYYVYISLISNNKITAIILSIITGLLYDICFSNIIGIYMFLCLGITILTPNFCNKFATETRIGMMVYIFITTFIFEIFYGIIYLISNQASLDIIRFVLIILITSIYNGFLTLFIHSIYSGLIKEKNEAYKIIRRY